MTTNTTNAAPDTTAAAPEDAPPADPRPALATAIEIAGAAIDAVRPAQMGDPTPCPDMDVRRLLGHLVMVAQRIACAGRGEPPMTWPGEVTGLADDAWAPAWRHDAAEAIEAWADEDRLARSTAVPWATLTGAEVVATYANEVIVHTWDLATATGQVVSRPDATIEVALAAMHAQLPDADRAPMWEAAKAALPADIPWEDPFQHAVAVAPDAALIDQLVAWNGRTPA